MATWYQRMHRQTGKVSWTREPSLYWSREFEYLSSIQSDVEPEEEYFDRTWGGQAMYNPPK